MDVRDSPPRLIVITDTTVAPPEQMLARIERLLALAPPRSVLVQLRDHGMPLRERKSLGEALRAACAVHSQWFGVNDRVDLAVLLRAPALHLGEHSVSTEDARRLVGGGTWISRACHDPDDVASVDADAVLLSPIVAARKGRRALGVAALAPSGARRTGLYALGGIDATSARACLDAGADGVAVIGAVVGEDDPRPLLAALRL